MPYTAGPFDVPHFYCQWGGKLPGNEQWSNGIRLASTLAGNPPIANDQAILDAVAAAVQAFHVNPNTNVSGMAKLSFVKVNAIGTDGKYIAATTAEKVIADVGGAGSGPPPYPNQVAIAVSFTTGFSRGPAHRGRMFVPLPLMGMDSAGLISQANATALAGSALTFVQALDAIANVEPAVFSRKAGAPAHRKITGTEVGRVLDTQRRRRRSLVEYS